MRAGAAVAADANLAERQVDVVEDDHRPFGRDLHPDDQGLDGLPALVHICLGQGQDDPFARPPAFARLGRKLGLPQPDVPGLGRPLDQHEPDVVPGVGITQARIPQAHDRPHRLFLRLGLFGPFLLDDLGLGRGRRRLDAFLDHRGRFDLFLVRDLDQGDDRPGVRDQLDPFGQGDVGRP